MSTPTKIGNVLSWATDLDDNTLEQAQRTAALPFVHSHLALMPDAHLGKGATIGSVIATRGAIIPSAVGVDIGCGMMAHALDLTSNDLPDNLDGLHALISRTIPAGVGQGNIDQRHLPANTPAMSDKQTVKARKQMGSLGSGNHFVEVCLDQNDNVWLMLHSGSRGIGLELAKQHIDAAKGLMRQYFIELDDPDLAYLVEGTSEFDAYMHAMLWAQEYARWNRIHMMADVLDTVEGVLDRKVTPLISVNCHHNFARKEHHHGRNVWVTRKGAVSARDGEWGIIPGSMATGSFIVQGKGNPASFTSCSHGAGRRMSRSKARKTLDVGGLREAMAGKAWNDRDASALIDEDPRSYKDIGEVMDAQSDLVDVRYELHQILNYKGL